MFLEKRTIIFYFLQPLLFAATKHTLLQLLHWTSLEILTSSRIERIIFPVLFTSHLIKPCLCHRCNCIARQYPFLPHLPTPGLELRVLLTRMQWPPLINTLLRLVHAVNLIINFTDNPDKEQ